MRAHLKVELARRRGLQRGVANRRPLIAIAILAALGGAGVAGAAPVITEFVLPSAGSPVGITQGPDGNLWFAEKQGVGKVTPSGVITEYTVPTAGADTYGIVTGPDGNLWFTEGSGNKVGKITLGGVITEYAVPTALGTPAGIAVGTDGNLWVAERFGEKIAKVTPAGDFTEYALPGAGPGTPSGPLALILGPDGNLWFCEQDGNRIGRITTAGVITEFAVPTAGSYPSVITVGPDGNLWFTETFGNKIGRIDIAGNITEFTIPTADSGPTGITAGPDGNLWFAEGNAGKVASITTSGVITEYPLPTGASAPTGIAVGADGNLWVAEHDANRIAKITGVDATSPAAVVLNDTGQIGCFNSTGAVACNTAIDDGRYGRDAAQVAGELTKSGNGRAGFDFTKVSNSGADLPASAALGTNPNDWACTRDNVTGLTWEMKSASNADLRFGGHSYTWYSTDSTSNGGDAGASGDTAGCNSTLPSCDTSAYVAAVNAAALCGYTDWRLPTVNELHSIVDYGTPIASQPIDAVYFPSTQANFYWAAQTDAATPAKAWVVSFYDGHIQTYLKADGSNLRLVRSGQ